VKDFILIPLQKTPVTMEPLSVMHGKFQFHPRQCSIHAISFE